MKVEDRVRVVDTTPEDAPTYEETILADLAYVVRWGRLTPTERSVLVEVLEYLKEATWDE